MVLQSNDTNGKIEWTVVEGWADVMWTLPTKLRVYLMHEKCLNNNAYSSEKNKLNFQIPALHQNIST